MSRRQEYSDGESEQLLLDYLSGKPLPDKIDIENDWRFSYHLSPRRHALLNWINLGESGSVLEIGAGCGALTGALIEKGLQVTALELSPRRNQINRLRHKGAKNLELVTGNLQNFSPKNKFDYIVCVGVLEYAGLFMDGEQPHQKFLQKLQALLKPEGVLILGIENRLGLKYWAGAREDHTEGFFDGINNYPSEPGLQTFGKAELQNLLSQSGYPAISFYYPYPDYKMPLAIYSDDYLPGNQAQFPLGVLPTPTSSSRFELFSEPLAMHQLEKNNLFAEFSNSFLVFAGSSKSNFKTQPSFIVQGGRTNPKFATQTIIKNSGSSAVAIKKPLGKEANSHITNLADIYKALSEIGELNKQIKITPVKISPSGSAEFEFVEGRSLERIFWDAVSTDDQASSLRILEHLTVLVQKISSVTPNDQQTAELEKVFGIKSESESQDYVMPGLIDINFDNIIVDDKDGWNLIDYEWCFDFPVPKSYIIGRTLWWFFGLRYGQTLRFFADTIELIDLAPGVVVPKYIYEAYKSDFDNLDKTLEIEDSFQSYVAGKKVKSNPRWKLYESPKTVQKPVMALDELSRAREVVAGYSELEERFTTSQQELAALRVEHSAMVNSRGWKALEKARKVKRVVKRRK